jgi:hypothetical protein
LHGVQGVASSNPAAPTSNTKGFRLIAGNPFLLTSRLGEPSGEPRAVATPSFRPQMQGA